MIWQCDGMRVVSAGVVRPGAFGLESLEIGSASVINQRLHVVGSKAIDTDMNDEIGTRGRAH